MATAETVAPSTPVAKKAKTTKAKTAVTKKKAAPSHPSFSEMITEAIVALKERTGSSQVAIAKFIEEKRGNTLPPTFRKLLLNRLKKLVEAGKLVKVKNSYKLPAARPSKASAPAAAAASKKKTKPAAAKPKSASVAATTKAKPKAAVKPKAKAAPKTKAAKPKPKAAAKPKAKASKSTPLKAKKVPVKKPKSVKKSPAKKKAKK